LYFRDYLRTDGSCYWFIVVVGFNGVVTAFATTDVGEVERILSGFPKIIKPFRPFNTQFGLEAP